MTREQASVTLGVQPWTSRTALGQPRRRHQTPMLLPVRRLRPSPADAAARRQAAMPREPIRVRCDSDLGAVEEATSPRPEPPSIPVTPTTTRFSGSPPRFFGEALPGAPGAPPAPGSWPRLAAGELQLGAGPCDLLRPHVLRQLMFKLGASADATVEKLTGFQGGLNEGIWILSDPASIQKPRVDFVLKLVQGTRTIAALPTEAENLTKLASEHPSITSDPALAFPMMILGCLGTGGKTHDLIIMHRAPGERLTEVLARKWHAGQQSDLWKLFWKVGSRTAAFHARYPNKQHGDLQPGNIFWDEGTGRVSFIDVGGMGMVTVDGDVAHFTNALHALSTFYGPKFKEESIRAFNEGYCVAGSLAGF